MRKRKSPIRHRVSSHKRKSRTISSFMRGNGPPVVKIRKTRISKSIDSSEVIRIKRHIYNLCDMGKSWKEIEDNVLAQWGGYPDYYSERKLLEIIREIRREFTKRSNLTFDQLVKKEMREHSWLTRKQAEKVVRDHMKESKSQNIDDRQKIIKRIYSHGWNPKLVKIEPVEGGIKVKGSLTRMNWGDIKFEFYNLGYSYNRDKHIFVKTHERSELETPLKEKKS